MKAKLESFINQALCVLVVLLALGHALYGCAHFKAIAASCDPVVSEVQAIAAAFAPADWQAKIDKYIADGHAVCKVGAAVDQVMGGQALVSPAQAIAPSTLDHMRTWRTANPK